MQQKYVSVSQVPRPQGVGMVMITGSALCGWLMQYLRKLAQNQGENKQVYHSICFAVGVAAVVVLGLYLI